MSGFYTPGLPAATSANGGLPLTGSETYPCDTNKTQGITPATVSLSGATMGAIGIGPEISLGTVSSGTVTVDATLGSFFAVTIGGTGHTLQIVNPSPGQLIEVEVTQGSASRTITTYNTKIGTATAIAVAWAANTPPTLTTTISHTDVLKFRYGGNPGVGSVGTANAARGESVLDVRNA